MIKNNLRHIFLKCILIFFAPVLLLGQVMAQETTSTAFFFLDLEGDTRANRLKAATGMLEQIESSISLIAVQKPSELEWLDAERAAISKIPDINIKIQRQIKFLESPEFSHQKYLNELDVARDSLKCIIKEVNTLFREVYCWTILLQVFIDSNNLDGYIAVLRANGRLPKNNHFFIGRASNSNTDSKLSFVYTQAGKRIVDKIIRPYFEGNLK
jgi:hypothetical protein